jgi:hypothetical protein
MNSENQPAVWWRLLNTPIRDLLSGRIAPLKTSASIIAQSDLPTRVKDAVRGVAQRSSIRQPRKRLVKELLEWCHTELAAGASVDAVLEPLADRRAAAKHLRKNGMSGLPAVALPSPLASVVAEVVTATRLSPNEQRDVGRELRDHFADGLAAKKTVDELLASFGNISQAAQMIRRAKIRNRPWTWRAWTISKRSAATLAAVVVLFWSFLFIRFHTARPVISRDYLAEMDRPFAGIPEEDRAWPLYREAMIGLADVISKGELRLQSEEFVDWPWNGDFAMDQKVSEIVRSHQEAIELLREAASRPRYGFYFRDLENRDWVEGRGNNYREFQDLTKPVWSALLPHLNDSRQLVYLLAADAWLAAKGDDPSRVCEDVRAMIGVAKHIDDSHPFLVSKLVSMANFGIAMEFAAGLMTSFPDLLSDEQLEIVSKDINSFGDGQRRIQCNLDGERFLMHDAIQRAFTDNGNDGGYMTRDGTEFIRQLTSAVTTSGSTIPDSLETSWVTKLTRIAFEPFWHTTNREEITELASRIYDFLETEMNKPRWERSSLSDHAEFGPMFRNQHRINTILYLLVPATDAFAESLDRSIQTRDATRTIIALHRYHRAHGKWPTELADLIPKFLDAIPIDQIDGMELRYKRVSGEPLLYSVGRNEIDDSGRPPENARNSPDWDNDGDWVLWPRVRQPMDE